MARFNSRFSARSFRSSSAASLDTPGRLPASISARRTQFCTVCAVPIPNFSATDSTAAHSDPCSDRISATIRTARSFNSAGYLFDVLAMTPSFPTTGVSGHAGAIQSFDEWNVWYQSRVEATRPSGEHWPLAPAMLEDNYTVADAVVVGNMMITLLRHSDRVTSANQAQLVNAIAPIMTEPGGAAWRQTTFYPFAQMSANARGTVLRVESLGPTFQTEQFGDVAAIDAAATWDRASATLAVFVVNREVGTAHPVTIDGSKFGSLRIKNATTLTGSDPYAFNSQELPCRVIPTPLPVTSKDGSLQFVAPAVSWTVITCTAE